ncbi:hypothetical protein BCV69DRAFT_280506 [Microstroma glucosiphilum]|uniref:Uncharacterized protein n=1 Tax=Pseudomicrostroma glucosiphilum TaxID=1684307 RepID=A0A316UCI5_9BASI|nr:hypothetical protein BCV69DRAFT_280506 [Pseudomicrostroma glucosiphilum]PWN22899.1 hypothetical protein BCV69DRAFT_280506 [Pseudomicrostroma glucosiphilum]
MQVTPLVRSTQGAFRRTSILSFGPRSALRAPPAPTSASASSTSNNTTTSNAPSHQAPGANTGAGAGATQSGAGTTNAAQGSPFELGYSSAHGKGRHLHEDVE